MSNSVDLYDSTYGDFAATVLEQVRRETFGEDIGQNSWLTADECRQFFKWLELKPTSNVLEVGSGSGGPALFMARTVGCHVTGIDNNEKSIATANEMTKAQRLDSLVRFQHADGSQPLPFQDQSFDSVLCNDAIDHLPGRPRVLAEWYRVLRPGGRILYTDPIIVTGIISNEEIAIRSSIAYFLFVPLGENERLIKAAGFELMLHEDCTQNVVNVSKRWHDARAKRREDLIKIEGNDNFEGLQRFLSVVYRLSSERRLSRFVFMASKRNR